MSNVLYVQNLEKQIAGQKQLIAEQNRLNKERQEWALHTSEVIRSLNQQLAAALAAIKVLRDIAEQSRGSVKFDLNRYEQLLTIKQKVGVEKSAQYIAMEIEANRLSKTIDGIDEALAATADLKDVILCHSEPVWHHKHWNVGDDNFYGPVDAQPDGCTPLYRAWEPKP